MIVHCLDIKWLVCRSVKSREIKRYVRNTALLGALLTSQPFQTLTDTTKDTETPCKADEVSDSVNRWTVESDRPTDEVTGGIYCTKCRQ